MVQLGSQTFRVVRQPSGRYGIVRLLDDEFIGAFTCQQELQLFPAAGTSADRLRVIARAAMQSGRTRWVPAER